MSFRIETARLVIRPWRELDRRVMQDLSADPGMMRYMTPGGRPWTVEELDGFFERQAATLAQFGHCLGAVESKSTGEVIGLAGLQHLGSTGELETGYWIARELWDQGLATEAALGALRHAFEVLHGPRVLAITSPDNQASRRVMEKLGMTFLGERTGAQLGHRLPEIEVVLYGIEREAWLAGRREGSEPFRAASDAARSQ